jgi:hypothetical protein
MKGPLMKKYLLAAIIAFLYLNSNATPITATVTADNHYALYVGDENGSNLSFIMRNEVGPGGSSGGYNWSSPETKTFDANEGQYLYIAAWSDGSTAQGLIGEFEYNGINVFTGTGWEWKATNKPVGDYGLAPSTDDVSSEIQEGGFVGVTNFADNGVGPWGNINGIDMNADWMWANDVSMFSGSSSGEYHLFSKKIETTNTPEPFEISLVLLSMTILAGLSFKRNKKA